MPEPGTTGMQELKDELESYADAGVMLNDQLKDIIGYTTVAEDSRRTMWDSFGRRGTTSIGTAHAGVLSRYPTSPTTLNRGRVPCSEVDIRDEDNYIYIDSAQSHAEAVFLQLHYYCYHDITEKPMDIEAKQMERDKIWLLYYHPARTDAQYEGFLCRFLPASLPRK
eukprot:6212761-Pleurochrysis_carterae.AAC.1